MTGKGLMETTMNDLLDALDTPTPTSTPVGVKRKKRYLTPKEIIRVGALLEEHLIKHVASDTRYYPPGWSDARVAREAGADVAGYAVRGIRISLYGKLYKVPKPPAGKRATRAGDIDVRALEQRLTEITDRLYAIEKILRDGDFM